MGMSRSTEVGLRVLAAVFVVGTVAVWVLVPQLLESAYAGTSRPLFNNLVSGREHRSLQDYMEILRSILILVSVFALAMSALAITLSVERGRQVIRGIAFFVAPTILLVIALAWVAIRAMASLDILHFGDVDEKIISAWLISDDETLYGSIFAHHGPLNYMIAHAVYVLTESKDLALYRIVQWCILGLCAIAVAASPILMHWRQRIYGASTFLILVAVLHPSWRGYELLYHMHGGMLFTTALSLLFLPLLLGFRIPSLAAGIAGSAMVAMVAAAYPFIVPLGFMFIATSLLLLAQGRLWSSTKELFIPVAIGAILMLMLVGAWLALNGDLVGYFVYHFYFNQVVYAPFIDFDPLLAFKQLARVFQPRFGWALWVLLIFSLWLFISLSTRQKGDLDSRARILLVIGTGAMLVAFLYLNPRDSTRIQMAALQVTSVGLFSLIAARGVALQSSTRVIPVWNIALPLLLFFLIALTQFTHLLGMLSRDAVIDLYAKASVATKIETIVDAVQSWVGPSEPIQALVFSPHWYLLTQRRPATGHFYYFPWQAAYSHAPILGKNIDICADLERVRPEVIVWGHWKVWGKYDLKDYEPCLYELITTQYEPIEGMPAELLRRRRR